MLHREEATFETTGGLHLFERAWLPDAAVRASIALVHGYAEHSGRYEHVGAFLAERGYAVRAIDLRGHGRSEGPRVLVHSFNEYLDDVDRLLRRTAETAAGGPMFLLGHSMGGAVSALAAAVRPPRIDGLLLSGPAISLGGTPGPVASLMVMLGRLLPGLRLTKLDSAAVSRDPSIVIDYDADPLNYRGRMPLGLISALIRAARAIDRNADRIAYPLLLMHGGADTLANPDGSRNLYDRVSSTDKTIRIYDGLFHEILNEPEKLKIMEEIASWLDARTTPLFETAAS